MTRFGIALAVGLLGASPVLAEPVTIAVGQQGRGYEARGLEIAQRLEQRGHDVTVENLEGSDAISLAVCGGRATLGIMQIDAIYARAKENCALKTIGTYGNEFAFILFPPDSRNNELDDLGKDDKILVDTIGSGTELFWRNIVAIETGDRGNNSRWAQATPVNDLTMLAETMAAAGQIDALLMVGVPSNDEVLKLLQNGWSLGELYDKDINDERFGDARLYEVETVEIEVPGRWRKLRNDAYVVPSFITITEETANGDRKLYGDLVAASQ